jgi:hypothetical protein
MTNLVEGTSKKSIKIGMYQPERFVNVKLKDGSATRRKGGFAMEFEVTPHHSFDIKKNSDAVYRQFLHKFYEVVRIQLKTGSKIMQLTEPILFRMETNGSVMDLGEASMRLGLNVKWGKKQVQQKRFNSTINELINVSMGSLDKWASAETLDKAISGVNSLISAEDLVRQAAKQLKDAQVES